MDEENKVFHLAGKTFHEGDVISIDGSTGCIYDGAIPTVDATIGGEFGRVMAWGGQVPPPARAHQRRHPPATPRRPASWARKASACAAPSTCSSTPTASPPSAR